MPDDITLTPPPVDWSRAAALSDAGSAPADAAVAVLDEVDSDAETPSETPSEQGVIKFAIVGFTPTAVEAIPLLDDDEWEVWGMNNLHLQPAFKPHVKRFDAWFDLHPHRSIVKDEPHAAWLMSGSDDVDVWVWKPVPEWPKAIAFPRDDILARFPHYFTNTCSWQMAMAILRIMRFSPDGKTAPEGSAIAVFGIDMATSSEYAAQRPSVEYFLGVAAGCGIKVELPERSDLLKSSSLYGDEDNGFRTKLDERREVLREQLAQHEQAAAQHQANVHACRGALEQIDYIAGVWTMRNIDRNDPQNAPSQDGLAAE